MAERMEQMAAASNRCVAENGVRYKLLGKYFMDQVSYSTSVALSLTPTERD